IRAAACKATTIGNVRLLQMESSYAVRYLLPPGSVEVFYLLFPDPWPKRRHWRRRIVNENFLRAINQALISGGTLHIATDCDDYFAKITEVARPNQVVAAVDFTDIDLPHTKYKRKFRAQGVT